MAKPCTLQGLFATRIKLTRTYYRSFVLINETATSHGTMAGRVRCRIVVLSGHTYEHETRIATNHDLSCNRRTGLGAAVAAAFAHIRPTMQQLWCANPTVNCPLTTILLVMNKLYVYAYTIIHILLFIIQLFNL